MAILGDLQESKIRVPTFKEGSALNIGDLFTLDSTGAGEGDHRAVGLIMLPNDVSCGDVLLLDDGRVQLEVYQ